jgi:glycosyltransferase involved in cell wall biosynthesis
MRLGIDTREALSHEPTGKGVWAKHVLQELLRRSVDVICFEANHERVTRNPLWHVETSWRLLQRDPPLDCYISPTSYIVPWLMGTRVPCGIVVHDLIAFGEDPHERKAVLIERFTLPRVLRRARWIFTVSETTKHDLLERFPKTDSQKITVVYEGPTVRKPATCNRKPATSPFILSIGTLCPRKNQQRLIEAFQLLPETLRRRTRLLLLGKRGWQDKEILRLAKETPNVEWRGYVRKEEMEMLLQHAVVFAYPSLEEGFGLPLLDALTLGVPTLTSRRGSLQEVAGDGAFLVDPLDIHAIAKGLERLLQDGELRKSLQEKGSKQAAKFRWERTVDLMLGALRDSTVA